MKKLTKLSFLLILTITILVVPLYFIISQYNNSLINKNPNQTQEVNDKNNNGNQGFYSLDDLKDDIVENLGTIELNTIKNNDDIIGTFIKQKFIKQNYKVSQFNGLSNDDFYLKSITINKARISIEGFVGYVDVKYRLKNIEKLIKDKNLGQISKLDNKSIFNKFKLLNPVFNGLDLSEFFSVKYKNLNEASLVSSDYDQDDKNSIPSFSQDITYELVTLDGLILNRFIGNLDVIKDEEVRKGIKEANSGNDSYVVLESVADNLIVNKDTLDYNSVRVQLRDDKIAKNYSDLNYAISNLKVLIPEDNLEEINKVSEEVVIDTIIEKNPMLKNYLNANKGVSLVLSEDLGLTKTEVKLVGTALDSTVKITYKCTNIQGIMPVLDLGSITDYNKPDPKSLIIKQIKSKNKLLNELKDDDLFDIENINYQNHSKTDIFIKSSFNLKIKDYGGAVNPTFNVQRADVKDKFSKTDIGKFYWTSKSEIMQKISSENNNLPLDNDNVELKDINYKSVIVEAKEESFKYINSVKFTFDTDFDSEGKNTKINNISNTKFVSNLESITQSSITSSPLVGTRIYDDYDTLDGKTLGPQVFSFDYLVPINLEEASKIDEFASIKLKGIISLSKFTSTGGSGVTGKSYKGENGSLFDVPIRNLLENGSYQKELDYNNLFKDMPIAYRTRSWGFCSNKSSLNVTSTFKFEVTAANKTNEWNQKVTYKITVTNKMSDYSTCDDFNIEYRFTVQGFTIE
ncbi:hypothetical protein [Spiroplasma turonicum]|uniref:Uncharacterized protein n=1 Tax=Spiroplasma turonicum TaxID=216946 RepID=A0A0K1P650_9MOLU|nr:hypothetical protein [Spiroplasma turonicum]AKU79654.1 hypothetical protein STURON_00408 [Spiroplasma turonicum]